jgi:membrane protein YdbS with pleckstrin-like domain
LVTINFAILLIINLIFTVVINILSNFPGIENNIHGSTVNLLIINLIVLVLALIIASIRTCRFSSHNYEIRIK